MNKQYKVTAFSAWVKPEEYIVNKSKLKDLKRLLKDQQYLIEVEEIK